MALEDFDSNPENEKNRQLLREELLALLKDPVAADAAANGLWPSIYAKQRAQEQQEADHRLWPVVLNEGDDVTALSDGTEVWGAPSRFPRINFLGSTVFVHDAYTKNQVDIRPRSGGADCMFDYLVSECWATEVTAGRGTEGQTFTSLTGCTFLVYSTVKGAVDHIITDNQDQWYTIYVCPGDYPQTIDWPGVDSGALVDGVAIIGAMPSVDGKFNHIVSIGPTTGAATAHAIYFSNSNPAAMYLENLTLRGASSASSIRNPDTAGTPNGGVNLVATWLNVFFQRTVNFDSSSVRAVNCFFDAGIAHQSWDNPDLCWFTNCTFNDTLNWQASNWANAYFTNCQFTTGGNSCVKAGAGTRIRFQSCSFDSTSGTDQWLYTTSTNQLTHLTIDNCDFHDKPATGQAIIRIQPTAGSGAAQEVADLAITNNRFPGGWNTAASATTAFIKLIGIAADPIRRPLVTGNTFGGDANDETSHIEDQAGFSVIGDYCNHGIFGPNAPAAVALYSLTNYTLPKVDGVLWGSGAPTHVDNYGAWYKDTATDTIYTQQTDPTGSSWAIVGVSGGGGAAPDTADYLVGTAQAGLSAEIVVGTSPGGELGGTWAAPTVDATHSGSTHSASTDTHIADTSDAHDASAISVADAGGLITATEVEAALQEIAATNRRFRAIVFNFDGGGSVLTTAIPKVYVPIPFGCTINDVKILSDAAPTATNLVFDIKAEAFSTTMAAFVSIVSAAPPTLTTTNRASSDATLTGWTTAIAAATMLECSLTTAPGTTKWASVTLKVTEA